MKKSYLIALYSTVLLVPCMVKSHVQQFEAALYPDTQTIVYPKQAAGLPQDFVGAQPVAATRAGTKTFIGTGRTITDYAIRSNDIQLMRLLGVDPKNPVKPAEDTAALKRLAIEEALENMPEKDRYVVVETPVPTQVVLEEKPVIVAMN